MDKKQVRLTEDGLKQLEERLEYLKTTKRKEVSEKIKTARGFGDLSENAEYDEAKKEQAHVEAEILSIQNDLKNVVVMKEEDRDKTKVDIGAKVELLDIEFDETVAYKIVGSTESDLDKGKLSDESPLGVALLGKCVGDTVDVYAPEKIFQYKILAIS